MALSLFGERRRRRSRRRSREKVVGHGLFGGERRRRRSRRRSREKVVTAGLFGAGERRRRRSRSRRRSAPVRRRRSRSVRLGERRRRRRSRSIGKRIRSGAKRLMGFSERRRRRSRRRSRSMFAAAPRRRSRSRRRSRELMPFLGERRRRRSHRRRSHSRGMERRYRRRSRELGMLSIRRNGDFVQEVLKPGAVAAVGLVGTRLLSQQVSKLTARLLPSSPTLAKWVPSGVSALSAWGVWMLSSKVQSLRPHRGYLAIGAGLAVVEELLAVVLPMVGLTPSQTGLAGAIGSALYGTDGGMGFPCFTGTCPQGVALPFSQGTPCTPGGMVTQYYPNGMPVNVQVNAAPAGTSGMGFPCFTGTCPQGVALPFPTNNGPYPACMDPNAPVLTTTMPNGTVVPNGTAAKVAVATSGFTDPVAQQVLAGLSGRAQEILSGAGM